MTESEWTKNVEPMTNSSTVSDLTRKIRQNDVEENRPTAWFARPLTCADRLPKQGDVLLRTERHAGHHDFLPYPEWWRVRNITVIGGWRSWCLEELRYAPHSTWIEWAKGIRDYRYKKRADGGRVDWPIDAGAYVE